MGKHSDTEVVFELRSDDSKLESDLNAAKKTVVKSTEETAKETEKTEENKAKKTRKITKETSEKIKDEQEEVTKHHKNENDEQEEDTEDSYKKREKKAASHGENLKKIAAGTASAIGASMLAISAGAIAIGTTAVNSTVSIDKAMNQFAATTGKSVNETERYQQVLESIYKNNYGENFEDISDGMSQVIKQLGDLSDESLQEVTESAFVLRDVFEYDLSESTRAAKALIDNFGLSGEKAMNMIAAGAQNGLDYSGELLDSINEYSVQFAKIGLDADDMFKIFEKGTESGAFNLDKVGDAIKELSIRVIDGSETTKEGFQAIGLNADKMAEKFAQGGASAKEAFRQTVEALAGIKDPLKQNEAGVSLFGTQWEDLGADAVTALADIEEGAYSTADAMDEIKNTKYNDLGSMFEGLKRSVEMLILPLGEMLIPILSDIIDDIMPSLEKCIPPLVDRFAELLEGLLPIVLNILPVLVELIEGLIPSLMQIIDEILPFLSDLISLTAPMLGDLVTMIVPILVDLLDMLLPPLMEIVSRLLPPLLSVVEALLPLIDILLQLLMPVIDAFLLLLDPIVDIINEAIIPLIEVITDLMNLALDPMIKLIELWAGAVSACVASMLQSVKKIVQNVIEVFRGIIDFIKCVFQGDWKGAWEAVVKIFENIFSGIAGIIKMQLNAIIDAVNSVLEGINGITIPDWVPLVGGKEINIPLIPRLKKGADFIPSDYYPAYLDYGERVLTREENIKFTALGGMDGIERSLSAEAALKDGSQNINVYNSQEMDYERLAKANEKLVDGMAVKLDHRELGRVVVMKEED